MAYVPKDGTGSLFANKNKKAENHPDREGSAMINGVEYRLAGWIKQDKEGKPYLSLKIEPKEESSSQGSGRGGEQQRDFRRERDEFF
jgi:hypothetical protein